MAISVRRALLASRNLSCAIRTASIHSGQTFSCINSSRFDISHRSVVADRLLRYQPTNFFQFSYRRGFAKARKQKISKLSICQFPLPPIITVITSDFEDSHTLLILKSEAMNGSLFFPTEFEILWYIRNI